MITFQVKKPAMLKAAFGGRPAKCWNGLNALLIHKHKPWQCPQMFEDDFKQQKPIQQYFYAPVRSCSCKPAVCSGEWYYERRNDSNGILWVIARLNYYQQVAKRHNGRENIPNNPQEKKPVVSEHLFNKLTLTDQVFEAVLHSPSLSHIRYSQIL